MECECPFDENVENLDAKTLSVAEKTWIGEEIVSKRCTVETMMEKYKLDRCTMNKWARLIRKKIPINKKEGRPPSLDKTSVEYIQSVLENLEADEPALTRPNLKILIKNEHLETLGRRGVDMSAENNDYEMSDRTLKRYLDEFWQVHMDHQI
jgi:hypothetical protein